MLISALEPAYLLHARPYRNTSLIANFFTQNHGRVDAVIRGARSQKSKIRGLVQLFTPVVISWYGHGDLVTIKTVEANGYLPKLIGENVVYGMYVNELMVRLVHGQDSYIELYQAYEKLLASLGERAAIESQLRIFEKQLLESLGYGLQLEYELDSGENVEPEQWYHYIHDKGPVKVVATDISQEKAFMGQSLLAIAKNDFSSKEILRDAKRLMRYALWQLLGEKSLNTREYFL